MRTTVVSFLLMALLGSSLPLSASAQTTDDAIKALLLQIAALQKELDKLAAEAKTAQATQTISGTFTRNLYRGLSDSQTGGEVSRLQAFLARDTAIYPEAIISGYFGALTERAVQRWQAKQHIVSSGTPSTTGYGAVGPKTRAALNAAIGTSLPGPTITSISATTSPVGKSITITGTGFLETGNVIRFGAGVITGIDSTSTGKKIVFTVPSYVHPPCVLDSGPCIASLIGISAGNYSVAVANRNGTSNTITFQVTGSGSLPSITLSTSGTVYIARPQSGTLSSSNSIFARFADSSDTRSITIKQSGLPTGATASVGSCSPQPCGRKNTVTIRPETPTGTYPITVTATARDTESASALYYLIVTTSVDFAFGVDKPRDISVAKPLSGSVTASNTIDVLYKGGKASSVTITQTGLPSDVSGFSSTSCTPGCTKINNLTIRSTTKTGSHQIAVTATNGKATSTSYYILNILDAVPFTYSVSQPSSISITRPSTSTGISSESTNITATHLTGYNQTMSFSHTGLPYGTYASFISSCSDTCTRTSTINVRSYATPGVYPITVNVRSGTETKSVTYNLTIR